MDKNEKMKLLIKYDFSAWRSNFKKSGFGNIYTGIFHAIDYLKHQNILFEDTFKLINESYRELIDYYSLIDFSELDKRDEDFRFFFDYSDKLIQLGQELNNLEQNIIFGRDFSFNNVENIILNDLAKRDYREKVLSNYDLEYSHLPERK
jgi:hypothetical protein